VVSMRRGLRSSGIRDGNIVSSLSRGRATLD
jgi:hypothetical protein